MVSGIFAPGEQFRINESNIFCQVEELLGAGGQGEVYRVSVNGKPRALKWYYPHTGSKWQMDNLVNLINKGSPDDRFLWPTDLLAEETRPGFGYMMPLRPSRYKGISDLLSRSVNTTLKSLVTACAHLSDAFLQLHSKGWCYRDISQGNMFFDPGNGEVLVCDIDNVGVNGGDTPILGTPRFMAPEVVRRQAKPSTETDRFSLAVMLFLVLLNDHPLDGRKEVDIHCFDRHAMERLYGVEPLFIFDPKDHSNEPVKGYHDNALAFWPIYPAFIKHLFVRSFTSGLWDPKHGRVTETEWRLAMNILRDSIFNCSCGAENFFDMEQLKATGGAVGNCWSCKGSLRLPPRIRIGKTVVMLNSDSKLFPHHLTNNDSVDFTRPFAEVSRHPVDPNRMGLKNLGSESWSAVLSDGNIREVPPAKSVALDTVTRIHFGRAEGEVRL